MTIFRWLFGTGRNDDELRVPFLRGTDGYGYEIVGESQYQNTIAEIAGPKTEDAAEFYVKAELIAEPSNQYDKNAVRVDIKGMTVGYIARHEAPEIQRELLRISRSGKARCEAVVVGGWIDDNSEGHYGVKLDLVTPLDAD